MYCSFQPDGYFIAYRNKIPVGMAGAIDYGAFAYIGMMAVDNPCQRQGIGAILFRHILEWITKKGVSAAFLDATDTGRLLYTQFGFKPVDITHLYALRIHPSPPPPDTRVSTVRESDIGRLRGFDTPIFGANRDKIFRTLLGHYPGRAFYTTTPDGRLNGYIFAQTERIGPWVASSEPAARSLLSAVLALPFKERPTVSVPGMNGRAKPLLEAFGFSSVFQNTHMRRCDIGFPDHRELVYGQTSFASG